MEVPRAENPEVEVLAAGIFGKMLEVLPEGRKPPIFCKYLADSLALALDDEWRLGATPPCCPPNPTMRAQVTTMWHILGDEIRRARLDSGNMSGETRRKDVLIEIHKRLRAEAEPVAHLEFDKKR